MTYKFIVQILHPIRNNVIKQPVQIAYLLFYNMYIKYQ
jgi:hypothetical protein